MLWLVTAEMTNQDDEPKWARSKVESHTASYLYHSTSTSTVMSTKAFRDFYIVLFVDLVTPPFVPGSLRHLWSMQSSTSTFHTQSRPAEKTPRRVSGGSSQDLKVVNNHGDRKSPRPGVVPLPNGLNGS